MKYYLLTFNQDWADEHNVPALACMKSKEYNEWLKKPSGKLNKNYEEEKKAWDAKLEKYNNYLNKLRARNLYSKTQNAMTAEEIGWINANRVEYVFGNIPKKVRSFLKANLGNGGENFEENYTSYYLMHEFVDAGVVSVMEVDRRFYDTFHKASLSRLSLCNIFDELYDYDGDDETEE